MNISLVPREEIPNIWQVIEPMLERAIEYNPGRVDTIDVYTDFLTGDMTLWIAFDEDRKIVGFAGVAIYDTPLNRIMSLEYLGGENMKDWLTPAFNVMNSYAHDNKVGIMECKTRQGMTPFLKELGWEVTGVHFERGVSMPHEKKIEEES